MGICEGWVGDLGTDLSKWCCTIVHFCVHDARSCVLSVSAFRV